MLNAHDFPKNNKIVAISDVMFFFQFVLDKLVKFVHIDIYKKLARKVAKWKSDAFSHRLKTFNNIFKKFNYVFVFNMFAQDVK